MKFHVPDMSCGHCTAAITKAIGTLDASATVQTDLTTRTIQVTSMQGQPAILGALETAGYPATPAD